MLRKGINAKLLKGQKVYGVIQAWVKEESSNQKSLMIGWSASKNINLFDSAKSEINSFKRASVEEITGELYIPEPIRRDMRRFINRCKNYYKDCELPDWTKEIVC